MDVNLSNSLLSNAMDKHLSEKDFEGVRQLTDVGRAAAALQLPVEAGTKVVFAGTLGAHLTYDDVPAEHSQGEVVNVKSANGDVTHHDGKVFVKWDDGKFRPIHAEHLRLAGLKDRIGTVRFTLDADLPKGVERSLSRDLLKMIDANMWDYGKHNDAGRMAGWIEKKALSMLTSALERSGLSEDEADDAMEDAWDGVKESIGEYLRDSYKEAADQAEDDEPDMAENYRDNMEVIEGVFRVAKEKLPDELKKHQFTSEDNPNPKGNDKDGDGETNEPSPVKGKKAGKYVSEGDFIEGTQGRNKGRRGVVTNCTWENGCQVRWEGDKDESIERHENIKKVKKAKEKYPWDECIADQMKEYGDKETAEKVCGAIKYKSQGKKAALIRLAATMEKGSEERRTILRMAKDLPDELKKHQFTSEDNPNPKGNDKDGDGETNEPSPLKGKKAMRVASLGDLTNFLKIAEGVLIHKSTNDLWSFSKDADGFVVSRLFDDTGEPLKG